MKGFINLKGDGLLGLATVPGNLFCWQCAELSITQSTRARGVVA